jgi:O-antigen/teichoic acid export membrane protein
MIEINDTPRRFSLNGIIARRLVGARMYLLLDQIVFSLANFILTIALARMYSIGDFGSYGVGLALAFVVQLIQRNLYIVSFSLMSRRIATRCLRGILAEHLTVAGATVMLVALGTGVMAATGTARTSLDIALSTLVCVIIYFQADFDRAMQVKRGSYMGALGLSLVYFVIVVAMAGSGKLFHLSFAAFMTTLGLVCALKSSWLFILHVRPHWSWGFRLLARDWRRYGMPTLIQAGASAGCVHGPLMVLAAVSGAAQVGGFIAMRSLTQPLMLVIRSLDAGDKNRFRLASHGSTAGARRVFWRTISFYGAIGVAALVVLGTFPDGIIALAYHGKYAGLGRIMIGWAVYSALLGLTFPIQSMVYLLHRQRLFTGWNMVSGAIGIALAAGLCGRFGMWGAMSATVLSTLVNVLGGLIVTRDIILGRADEPLPKEFASGRFAD